MPYPLLDALRLKYTADRLSTVHMWQPLRSPRHLPEQFLQPHNLWELHADQLVAFSISCTKLTERSDRRGQCS